MALTVVYIADEDRGSEVKLDMLHYPHEIVMGTVGGLGTNPSYISDICNQVFTQADKINMVIFDLQSMGDAFGGGKPGNKQALQGVMDALKMGLAKATDTYIYDQEGIINRKGMQTMEANGVSVVRDLADIGGIFRRVYGNFELEEERDRTHHKDPEMVLPAMTDGAEDMARRDGVDLVSERDYFSDAARITNTDIFNDFMDREEGTGRYQRIEEPEETDFDADALWDDADRVQRPNASMEDFWTGAGMEDMIDQHDDDYYEEEYRKNATFQQNDVEDDLKPIAWLAANPEAAWTYDEICEALSKPGSSLFKSRNNREKLGEVSSASLYHSQYIQQQQDIRGGIYQAPNECKIVSCYSLAGGSGKCLVNREKIKKYNSKTHTYEDVALSEIQVGDEILGSQGLPTKVLGVYPQGEREVYRVILRDGRHIDCSDDHIWTVLDVAASTEDKLLKRTVDKTTKELIEGGLKRKGKESKAAMRWKLPVMKAVQYPHRDLTLDPYILGLLIGDGTLGNGNVTLTCASDRTHLIDSIQSRLPENYHFDKVAPQNPTDLRWVLNYHNPILGKTNNKLNIYKNEIRRLGLDHRTEYKFIPEEYLHADEQQRRELLAGLLDSDGSVAERGQISFSTINARLKDDFCELVHSLGYVCSIREDRREDKYITGIAYDIGIWTNDVLNLLPEKAQRSIDHMDNLSKRRPEMLPAKDVDAPDIDLPLSPYLMGRICRSTMTEKNPVLVTSYSDEDREHLLAELEPIGCKLTIQTAEKRNTHRKAGARSFTRHRIVKMQGKGSTPNPIITILRNCGMYGTTAEESFFPEEYLNGSVRQRKELLQGIMDSFGKIKESYPYVSTKNERFRNELIQLAESLGYTVEAKTQTQTVKDGKRYSFEMVRFLNTDPSIFLMSPDRELFEGMCESFDNPSNDDGFIAITDIVKTGEREEMTCLYVDAPDHLFVAGDYIVTHNTTVAGMIGVQLNWCFNREVMQKRSTAWTARILVLSLNEFDDLSVKGIGYDNPMGNTTDRKNIAELLRRIEECGGEPEWDDISDCFAANTENYVYYVPSLTLKERLELNIDITAENYKTIITVCSKFFGFIVLDMPDIMYDHKDGLVEFALNNAHIVVYIMEPNTKSTTLLFQLLQGLRDRDGNLMIAPDKWMIVVNKYAKADSPYIGHVEDYNNFGQVRLDSIRKAVAKYFFDIQAIPLTSRRDQGNIIFGRDPNVKMAARDIVDSILAQIDENDGKVNVRREPTRRRR